MKPIGLALSLSVLLLAGCGEHKSEAKMIESRPSGQTEAPAPAKTAAPSAETAAAPAAVKQDPPRAEKAPAAPAPQLSRFYQVFKDGASIDPAGKPMLLVFGQSADPYTQKLQNDVAGNETLAKAIEADVTPIYIDAMSNKRHKFMHSGQMMDVDTKTLISIYHIDATPTLIFTDEKGQSIFIVPGYMPPKQFEVTLQFVKEGVWRGKDRKNGDVYRALKAYYAQHGVKIGGPKK